MYIIESRIEGALLHAAKTDTRREVRYYAVQALEAIRSTHIYIYYICLYTYIYIYYEADLLGTAREWHERQQRRCCANALSILYLLDSKYGAADGAQLGREFSTGAM